MKNTDTKDKILELLFEFPTRRFHLREISRILKISPSAISPAVKQLEKECIVTINKKFLYEIQVIPSNQQFKSLKRVYDLKSIYSSGLFDYLYENFSLDIIVLFGSYSKGEDIEKSDIDIAINSKEKRLNLENYEKLLKRKINIEFIDFNKISKELKDSIINGIVLSGYITIK